MTLAKRLATDPLFYMSCLVVCAATLAVLSALLRALLDGVKKTGKVDVPPYHISAATWKTMDYPKVQQVFWTNHNIEIYSCAILVFKV